MFQRKHPVSSRACADCGKPLHDLGDATCWFEVFRRASTGEFYVQEFHLRCEGEQRRHHGSESSL